MTDRVLAYELPASKLPPGYVHRVFSEVSSTMTLVNDVLERRGDPADLHHGLIIQALNQTAGRGASGSKWQSGSGNLMFSMIVDSKILHPQEIGLIAMLALIDTMKQNGIAAPVTIKMVNDLFIGNAKFCGILSKPADARGPWVNLGVGINVGTPPLLPETSPYRATCLRDHGWSPDADPQALLLDWIERFDIHYRVILNNPTHVWEELGAITPDNQHLKVQTPDNRIFMGRYEGMATDGHGRDYILLNDNGSSRAIQATRCRVKIGKGWTAPYPGA